MCTIYNFYMNLIKYNIINGTSFIHNYVVNNYLSKLDKLSKLLYNLFFYNTPLIMNKLCIDMVSSNS